MWFYPAIQHLFPDKKSLFNQIQNFCIDSRKAIKGSLFFALPGEQVDGHDYLEQAYKKGAIAAVVCREPSGKKLPIELIYVEDVKKTLQEAAKRVVQYWKPKIIGVTGSLGKTSVKNFIHTFTKDQKSIWATPGNYNTQLTLPLTILNAKKPTEFLLLEMGLDQPKEIDLLLNIAPPDISVLTMLAHVHIEAFLSFEDLAHEKMKIFSKKRGVGFYNLDMPFSENVPRVGDGPKISYSLIDSKADFFLTKEKDQIEIFKKGASFLQVSTPLLDLKGHINLLGAIAVADYLGVTAEHIKNSIPQLRYEKNRLEKIEKKGISFLCDAYNSNLDSSINALKCFSENFEGRKIGILGGMTEQGVYCSTNHQKLAEEALLHLDYLIGFGEEMKEMIPIWKKSKKRWAFFLSYPNMLGYISKMAKKGDSILIKGSRKFALERVLHDIDIH